MREYEFEVTIVAVVRVRAGNENRAREVVASSALGSPKMTWPFCRAGGSTEPD
jgi:hypothetical protein